MIFDGRSRDRRCVRNASDPCTIADHLIADHPIADHPIADHPITNHPITNSARPAHAAPN